MLYIFFIINWMKVLICYDLRFCFCHNTLEIIDLIHIFLISEIWQVTKISSEIENSHKYNLQRKYPWNYIIIVCVKLFYAWIEHECFYKHIILYAMVLCIYFWNSFKLFLYRLWRKKKIIKIIQITFYQLKVI